jgi:hypothetical protein
MSRTVKRLFAVAAPLGLAGCVSAVAAAGIGTYAYLDGEGSQDYAATVERTFQAALHVCDEAKLSVDESARDDFSRWILARMSDGTRVRFHIRRLGERVIHVGVRVGAMDDYALTLTLQRMMGAGGL